MGESARPAPPFMWRCIGEGRYPRLRQGEEHMDTVVRKRFILTQLAALLIGLSAVCCMVLADISFAAVPAGLDCRYSDGKIDGRGSTMQTVLQREYIKVYGEEFCGNVAEQYTGDPAGNAMIAYNYPKSVESNFTGSGSGVAAAICRTDDYAGTAITYDREEIESLNGEPQGILMCEQLILHIHFEPPFQPDTAPFPNSNDIAAPVMTLPIGGSAVTVAVHLTGGTGGSCPTGTVPTTLKFTPKEVSRLYGGDITAWNDPELVATNSSLSNCTGSVTRVVREDKSGESDILKQYLVRVDNERTDSACGVIKSVVQKWEASFTAKTKKWPGRQKIGEEGSCSRVTTAERSGGSALVYELKETAGGIGYIDLAEAVGQSGIVLASVENATGTKFELPSIGGGAANCLYTALPAPPGSTNAEAVGLNPEDNWSNNNETNPGSPANHENATDLGSKYPICGLAFDLVYKGLDSNDGAGQGAISRLTADQRRQV